MRKLIKSMPDMPDTNKGLSNYKQVKDGSYKVYHWKVKEVPTPQFPQMVLVENKNLEISKKFCNFEKAFQWIEKEHTEQFADKTGKGLQKALKTIGKGELVNEIEINESAPKEEKDLES